jgi:topoisomerase IA-like protein
VESIIAVSIIAGIVAGLIKENLGTQSGTHVVADETAPAEKPVAKKAPAKKAAAKKPVCKKAQAKNAA